MSDSVQATMARRLYFAAQRAGLLGDTVRSLRDPWGALSDEERQRWSDVATVTFDDWCAAYKRATAAGLGAASPEPIAGQPAERREALTRSRIEHWLRNRNLMFYDVGGVGIGFGPTVEAIVALMDDVLECDPTSPGQWLEGVHVDRRVGA